MQGRLSYAVLRGSFDYEAQPDPNTHTDGTVDPEAEISKSSRT